MPDKKISEAQFKTTLSPTDMLPVAKVGDTTAYFITGQTIFNSVPTASTGARGIVELATATEAQAGLSASQAVTPYGLAYTLAHLGETKHINELEGEVYYSQGGAKWRTYLYSSPVDPNDHVFKIAYNIVQDTKDMEAEPVAVLALESSYNGVFEWNLDLMPGGLNRIERTFLYNYDWETYDSVWKYVGMLDLYQNQAAYARPTLRVRPYSDSQEPPCFVLGNAEATEEYVTYSPRAGFDIRPSEADKYGLTITRQAGQTQNLQEWRDEAANPLSYINKDGNFYSAAGGFNVSSAEANLFVGKSQPADFYVFMSRVTGDTHYRIRIRNTGVIELGPGSGDPDVNVFRGGAGLFKTDAAFQALGGYKAADATAGATATVAVAKVGGGTRTLSFKNGLYTGYTDS